MTRRFLATVLAALLLTAGGIVALQVVNAPAAQADSCYTFKRDLKRGSKGGDVKRLQVRIGGWVDRSFKVVPDGVFGSKTEKALRKFQRGYGLRVTGKATASTYRKIYALQDSDCTPKHFSYGEFNHSCGERDFTGGRVSARKARANTRRVMWQLEALRHKLGDRPLVITSGFRSVSCNASVGGASNSLHTYGRAGDLGLSSGPSQCTLAKAARSAGFGEILGPGYPGHNDHVHVGNMSSRHWSAPNCGI
ncbi:MAG: D-Ala-D-Ala carboxypeptidase family metallohydrolase [Thermocrispum sp.]